jgi:Mlc titration factor MtfA (ptsG expression regulator)
MFAYFKKWRENRILSSSRYTDADWRRVSGSMALLDRLTDDQLRSLFTLATLFLHKKHMSGAHDFGITDEVRQSIALQACLPILELGLEWYKGWSTIIVYPAGFKSETTTVDSFGVTHTGSTHRSGEAWLRGPVILSWADVKQAGDNDGQNVVIHEFVHKLDMLNGRANGFPPMQPGMDPVRWAELMSNAYENFQVNPKQGLDRYGATNPAEFFAVLSEVFFETPELLVQAYPDVYETMTQFFLQSPLEQGPNS